MLVREAQQLKTSSMQDARRRTESRLVNAYPRLRSKVGGCEACARGLPLVDPLDRGDNLFRWWGECIGLEEIDGLLHPQPNERRLPQGPQRQLWHSAEQRVCRRGERTYAEEARHGVLHLRRPTWCGRGDYA